MNIETLKEKLDDNAKDLRLNLSNVLGEGHLTPQQVWGTAVACAIAARHSELLHAIKDDARPHLSEQALQAAKAAAGIMSMNNIYYRSVHLLEHEDIKMRPARLRMNVIANPGVDKLDFELSCLAVSAIHGCSVCIKSHEKELKEKGASADMIQDALRIAAVIHGVAVMLDETENSAYKF